MNNRVFSRSVLSCSAAAAMLAGCGGGSIGSPAAVPRASAIATHTGGVQAVQLCPGQYAECITLAYGSPFKQPWCMLPPAGLGAGMGFTKAGCKKFLKSGAWTWKAKILKVSSPRHFGGINVSFDPNPGNPTELTLSEKRRLDSSNGQIVYEAELHACSPFSGGVYCPAGHAIGIGTKN